MASDGNKGLVILVGVLIAGLVAVLIMWQQDRESKDVELDIGDDASVRSAPAQVATHREPTAPVYLTG